jgi:hypothetical protein
MKQVVWMLVLCVFTAPAWGANKKITVQQLKDLLVTLQQRKKTDEEVSTQLKEIDLSEELTENAADSLESYLPGAHSAEQIEILKGQSAFHAPPAAEIPTAPAPDAAAQKVILDKAADFATKVYAQNPHLSVIKSTLRYEDQLMLTNSIGMHDPELLHGPMQLVEKHVDPVETDKGVEKSAVSRAKTKWGTNGQISEGEPGTNLGAIVPEALSAGKVEWLRWQTIDGKQTAVFSFAVEKKKSHFLVSYCCFPKTEIQDNVMGPLTQGAIQSISTFEPFKKTMGYHGEFFINPDSGVVVRMITQATMKPSDYISREDRRVDYGSVVVDGKEYVLPRIGYTETEATPNGDSSLSASSVRHTFFYVAYQNYKLAE